MADPEWMDDNDREASVPAECDRADEVLAGQPDAAPTDGKEPTKSAATLIVGLALDRYTFGVSGAGEPFAVPLTGPQVVRPLRGGKTSLRAVLAADYFRQYGKAAPQQALSDALLVLEGQACDAQETELHIRVAEHDGALWLDLGDATARAVRITRTGWQVLDDPPVRFKRTTLQLPLPEPKRGGTLDDLRGRLNVADNDWPLILGWLVACLFPSIPHPLLTLIAEQGTGKSTLTKTLVGLLDPSPVPLRKPPRDTDSWVTAASGSWIVALDNLSGMPDWLSDSLSRAVTGEGDVRRRLYTDGDFAVFEFKRCLIANGIEIGALLGDLGERILPVNLATIPATSRRTEGDIWKKWTDQHPLILGALLDLVAGVMHSLPSVKLVSLPRMADFARILAAVDQVLGTSGLSWYSNRAAELAADQLAGEPLFVQIAALITEPFTGTAGELLAKVTPTDEKWRAPRIGWPKNARAATGQLRRISPTMRKIGWTVTDLGRSGHVKAIRFQVAPPEQDNDDEQNDDGGDDPADTPHAELVGKSRRNCPRRPHHAGNAAMAAGNSASNAGIRTPVAGNSAGNREDVQWSAGTDFTLNSTPAAGNAGNSGNIYGQTQDGTSPATDARTCPDAWSRGTTRVRTGCAARTTRCTATSNGKSGRCPEVQSHEPQLCRPPRTHPERRRPSRRPPPADRPSDQRPAHP